ncbi:hypothetical protein [Nocardiopsis synnemataformans]|uniref:hypothetical protein n=1 Tax=Nocardiopsis synnemataformans TaxID=61305 RepID=UPI003EB92CED
MTAQTTSPQTPDNTITLTCPVCAHKGDNCQITASPDRAHAELTSHLDETDGGRHDNVSLAEYIVTTMRGDASHVLISKTELAEGLLAATRAHTQPARA